LGTNKVLLLLNEHGDPSFLFQNLSSYNINNRQSLPKISVQVLFQWNDLNPCTNADAMFYSCKSQFREKNLILPFEKFPFLALTRNMIMLPHPIIHSLLHYLSTGCLREVKNKGKFQTFSYKSGCGRLQEVVAYKRFQT